MHGKYIKLYTYIMGLHTQFCIADCRTAHLKTENAPKFSAANPTREAYSAPANTLAGGEGL